MAKANKKVKEYESIKVIKHLTRSGLKEEIEIITRLTYTPFDGGKGCIVKVGPEKATMEE